MRKQTAVCSIWLNPSTERKDPLEGIELGRREVIAIINDRVAPAESREIEERIKPFETRLAQETLSKLVN